MIWIVKNIVLFLLFYSSSFAYGDKNSTVPQSFIYNNEPLSAVSANILAFDLLTMDLTSELYFEAIDMYSVYRRNYCLKLASFGEWLEKHSDPIMSTKEYKSIRKELLKFFSQFVDRFAYANPILDKCESVLRPSMEILMRIGNFYNFQRRFRDVIQLAQTQLEEAALQTAFKCVLKEIKTQYVKTNSAQTTLDDCLRIRNAVYSGMQTACSNGDYLYDPFSSDMINIAKARVLTSLIDHERLDYFNSTSNWYIENKQWCTLFSDLWYEISEMFHYNKHFSLTGLYLMNSLVNNYKNGYKLKLRGENECKEALMHTYRIIELNKKLFSSNKK
ncbi:hypothetical protein T4D_12395 [Trichinella pseudospiralis]|uniref:Uncharacterized protein n=1 Tax=Trichinella pseudospiralis TaxID=6337 RepID=A0A0V1FD72_TRIPS|nr:hypothetical protein T4D_6955 [Trichinella pseudospiralis]KRY86779.1 hypothetical protein T4D_12395 [Trichinella pseudospiralis]